MAKLQRERAENVAVWALFVQLALGLIAFWVARRVGLSEATRPDLVLRSKWGPAAVSLAWYLVIGVGFWLMTWAHLRQLRLAELEEIEWKRMVAEREAAGARGRLFEEDEIAAQVARSRLRVLEKYVLPLASLLLSAAVGALGWRLLPLIGAKQQELGVRQAECAFSAAMLVVCAMGTFLMGMYASGMSRQREWRPLRAGAAYMMSSALLAALTMAGLAIGSFGADYFWLIRIAAYVIPGIMMLTAVDIFVNFVLDFYRPRIAGVEFRPSYDSRLLGMLAEPGGLFRTVASTLDYQFGFKVSETWFYQFLERAIAPLFLFMLASLHLLTCVVIVGPAEEAIIERFGVPVEVHGRKVLGPGLYVKLPWPISKVHRYNTLGVRRIDIGFDETMEGKAATPKPSRSLWTEKHYEKEYQVLVAVPETAGAFAEATKGLESEGAVPVGLIAAVISVFYRVDNFYDYLYQKKEPEKVLRALAYRQQQMYFAGVDFFDVMGPGRKRAGERLREAIQKAADEERLGVDVLRVCLHGIHPPVEEGLGQAFEGVVAAEQEKQAEIHKGEAYSNARRVSARYDASIRRAKAHEYRVEKREKALADVARQQGQWVAYEAAPEVYKMREYLDAVTKALQGGKSRKYLNTLQDVDLEVLSLNLEDKVRLGIEGVDLKEKENK